MNNKSKHHSPWGTSLRVLPWDKLDTKPTLTEKLISSTVQEWYIAKHRDPSKEEIKLINSIEISECPICGYTSYIKFGYSHEGIQQYKCQNCNVRFTAVTNTIFQDRKIPISEWIEYLMHLFEFHSVVTSARDITEMQVLRALTGFIRFSQYLKISRRMLFLKEMSILMKCFSQSSKAKRSLKMEKS